MDFLTEIARFTDADLIADFPLRKKTTFGTGGKCKYLIEVKNLVSLRSSLDIAKECGVKTAILGGGSNLLFSDKGFDGAVISLGRFKLKTSEKNTVKFSSGVTLPEAFNFCLKHSLSGFESISSIPGTVGGGILMNASAFGHSISDDLVSVTTLSDGKIKKYYKEDCEFGYRDSIFRKNGEIIVFAEFDLKKGNPSEILSEKEWVDGLRRANQPTGRSFGSVFKNPEGTFTAKLIEGAGLKGFKIGGASFSDKHANFIINDGSAKTEDAVRLIETAKNAVKDRYGVSLKEEVIYIGR